MVCSTIYIYIRGVNVNALTHVFNQKDGYLSVCDEDTVNQCCQGNGTRGRGLF